MAQVPFEDEWEDLRQRFRKEGLNYEFLRPEDRLLQVWRWLVVAETNLQNSGRNRNKRGQQHKKIAMATNSSSSSQKPAPECSTAWTQIDDDSGQQIASQHFLQLVTKEQAPVEAGEGCSEGADRSTVNRSGPAMWPSICSTSGLLNATQVGRLDGHNVGLHSVSPVQKCTKPTVTSAKVHCCEQCSYQTPRLRDLKQHIRKHTGEKPFSCQFCDYRCARASHLNFHLRTHSGERPFSCDFCEYKSAHSYHLKTHVLRTHKGEKPFRCEYCNYECSQSSSLTVHLRTHLGEKPFSCDFCDYQCSQSFNLKRHLRTHTGDKPFSCKFCKHKCSTPEALTSHLITHRE